MPPHILIVEDDRDELDSLADYLELKDFATARADCLEEARKRFDAEAFDGVLLDLQLPDGNGLDWIEDLRAASEPMAVIAITGSADIPTAVEAMRRGADHFLTKPIDLENLQVLLRRALEVEKIRRKDISRKRRKGEDTVFRAESAPAAQVWELAASAAGHDAPVLITGETGTGKGVMARWIHDHSARADEEFVEINCSSLGGDLLASELFGHRKGAFTSAVENREGLVEIADGGTLFLDEIGDMELEVQAKFLKVIEEKRFRRLGETKVRQSEFRLLCATNMDLAEAVQENRFREDLYYRICVFPIHVPPLRQLREDLPALIDHQLKTLSGGKARLAGECMKRLSAYAFPGNVRELRNVLERARLLAVRGEIRPEHLPGLEGDDADGGIPAGPETGDWSLETNEARHLRAALDNFGGDVTRAAAAVGVSRATFYRKMKKHNVLQTQDE